MYDKKNQSLLIVCFFLLGTFSVIDCVQHDPDLEKYLLEVIDNFRNQMKEGIPEVNIPVLDPLQLEDLNLDVQENLATMNLKIHQLQVLHLSKFNVTNLKPDLENFYLDLNLTLPELMVNGNYSVNGRLVKIFPIYGQGKFELNASKIHVFGMGQLGFAEDSLEMRLLKLNLQWESLSLFMENFLGGGNFSETLQRVITGVGKDVFERYKPIILEKLEQALTNIINEKLQDPLAKDIIKGVFEDHSAD
ncbi:uncharacterized protein LOC129218468 [Uloborus diversus]|uniref:uncharacterized protein LOC129218468 n=1 Tax=Uloborus diversus TaxID=327109 RepID=UPI00240926B0|nr:uncharacterized protein LOC129218468 [Uloborus diversus]